MKTLYQKVILIRNECFHELHREKEREFIEDMYEGLDGLPSDINDEDITDYLTKRQISWINDIANALNVECGTQVVKIEENNAAEKT